MILDKLKTSWKQYQLESSLQDISRDEILWVIDAPGQNQHWDVGVLVNACVFIFLLICCQGG